MWGARAGLSHSPFVGRRWYAGAQRVNSQVICCAQEARGAPTRLNFFPHTLLIYPPHASYALTIIR
jgi:hypothetical protein